MKNNISMSLRTIRVSHYVFWSREYDCNISDSHKLRVEKIFKWFLCLLFKRHFDIFLKKKDHTNHVRLVLKRLKRHKMFVKLNKCVFDLKKIDYLKFIVEINDIRINFAKIVTIKKWVKSTTRRHVRIFIKFARFYKKFIKKFNKIVESLTNLLKEKKKRIR
jgi:hypothetical protein